MGDDCGSHQGGSSGSGQILYPGFVDQFNWGYKRKREESKATVSLAEIGKI